LDIWDYKKYNEFKANWKDKRPTQDPRFLLAEKNDKNAPKRPDMPDEEPSVLLQMQQNIAIQLGIAQNRSISQDIHLIQNEANNKNESSGSNEKPRLKLFAFK
jgi:hypothetical protein